MVGLAAIDPPYAAPSLDDVQSGPCHGVLIHYGDNPRLPKNWGSVNDPSIPTGEGCGGGDGVAGGPAWPPGLTGPRSLAPAATPAVSRRVCTVCGRICWRPVGNALRGVPGPRKMAHPAEACARRWKVGRLASNGVSSLIASTTSEVRTIRSELFVLTNGNVRTEERKYTSSPLFTVFPGKARMFRHAALARAYRSNFTHGFRWGVLLVAGFCAAILGCARFSRMNPKNVVWSLSEHHGGRSLQIQLHKLFLARL